MTQPPIPTHSRFDREKLLHALHYIDGQLAYQKDCTDQELRKKLKNIQEIASNALKP